MMKLCSTALAASKVSPPRHKEVTEYYRKNKEQSRTAEGIQKALQLTTGCVSLGLDHELPDDDDLAALDLLIDEGAEHAFQVGFRMIKDLVAMPEDALVGEYDTDPVYAARRMRDKFVDICLTDPNQNWDGTARYAVQFKQRKEVQGVVRVSEDGSHVYFVAKGVLTASNREGHAPQAGAENLYVYEPDPALAGGFHTVFVATLLTDGPLATLSAEDRAKAIDRTSDFLLNGIKGAQH